MPSGDDYRNAGKGNWLHRADYVSRVLNAKHSTFRLQVHPQYLVPAERESFDRFLATGKRHIDPNDNAGIAQMRERVRAGKKPQRVQVLTPPLSDYLRYAFGYYHHSAEAGEDLRILDTTRADPGGLPDYDFMVIDERTLIKVHYEPEDGVIIGPELLADSELKTHLRYRDIALSRSTRFLDYESR